MHLSARTLRVVAAGALLAQLALLAGCVSVQRDRAWVSRALTERTGHGIPDDDEGAAALPSGVALDDGLDEDEAVAIALHRSPTYRADLARLPMAQADLDQASRLENPRLGVLGPIGVIAGWATLALPLDSLFQLPARTETAARALESVAESLVQSGLDLARDARLAHVERALAEERARIRATLAETADEIARIAEARARTGDVSPAEPLAARAESSIAADASETAARDVTIASARLALVLGLDPARYEPSGARLPLDTRRPLPAAAPPLGDLVTVARRARPDVRAAELAITSAAARAGWERARIVSISAQIDGQWNAQTNEFGTRIGGSLSIPIFDQNQGGIGRADAGVTQAEQRLEALRQRVAAEIIESRARLAQALASLDRYEADVLPPLEESLRAAQLAYELGDQPYLVVLDALRRLGEARLRQANLVAETGRARAELERAVGARLELPPRAAPRVRVAPTTPTNAVPASRSAPSLPPTEDTP